MFTFADGEGGWGSQNWSFFADVINGWPVFRNLIKTLYIATQFFLLLFTPGTSILKIQKCRRGVIRTFSNICDGAFLGNASYLSHVKHFRKKDSFYIVHRFSLIIYGNSWVAHTLPKDIESLMMRCTSTIFQQNLHFSSKTNAK